MKRPVLPELLHNFTCPHLDTLKYLEIYTPNSLIRRGALLEYFNLLQAALGPTNIHEI